MSEDRYPIPPAPSIDDATKETEKRLGEYMKGVNPGQREKEAPLLAVASARESAAHLRGAADMLAIEMRGLQMLVSLASKSAVAAANELGSKVEGVGRLMGDSERHLAERIDAFTTATDASTRQLGTWTKVMAWATIALAVFAVAQVVVALLAWLKPH
jgi:hypothetical protein